MLEEEWIYSAETKSYSARKLCEYLNVRRKMGRRLAYMVNNQTASKYGICYRKFN